MNTTDSTLCNRISDYFRARFHTKDYLVKENCLQGIQTGSPVLDGTVSLEVVNYFLDGSLSPTDNFSL